MRQIWLQAGIFLSTTLSYAQPILPKTPMNDLDNYVLLLFRHLVITRQAEPSTENVGSYVHPRAFYVSICATSTVALNYNERVCPVYRLLMHWLPNWAAFGVEVRKSFENFGRTCFPGLAYV